MAAFCGLARCCLNEGGRNESAPQLAHSRPSTPPRRCLRDATPPGRWPILATRRRPPAIAHSQAIPASLLHRLMAYIGPDITVADVVVRPSRSIIKQSYDARERRNDSSLPFHLGAPGP